MTTAPEQPPEGDPSTLPRCLTCNYALHGLAEPRCPECGRAFDPDDPDTFMIAGQRSTRHCYFWLVLSIAAWVSLLVVDRFHNPWTALIEMVCQLSAFFASIGIVFRPATTKHRVAAGLALMFSGAYLFALMRGIASHM